MDTTFLRILVVEDEYLIAMDAERILSDSFACTIELSNRREFAKALASSPYHIVVLDTGASLDELPEEIARIVETGAAVVLTTSDNELIEGLPGFDTIAVLAKPYDDDRLIEVVRTHAASCAREQLPREGA